MTGGHERHGLDKVNGQKTPLDESAADAMMKARDATDRVMDKALVAELRSVADSPLLDQLGALPAPVTQAEGGESVTPDLKRSGVQR